MSTHPAVGSVLCGVSPGVVLLRSTASVCASTSVVAIGCWVSASVVVIGCWVVVIGCWVLACVVVISCWVVMSVVVVIGCWVLVADSVEEERNGCLL